MQLLQYKTVYPISENIIRHGRRVPNKETRYSRYYSEQMEVHIGKEKILEDARGGDHFPEIYSQVARETRSAEAPTRGCHYSQVFFLFVHLTFFN